MFGRLVVQVYAMCATARCASSDKKSPHPLSDLAHPNTLIVHACTRNLFSCARMHLEASRVFL